MTLTHRVATAFNVRPATLTATGRIKNARATQARHALWYLAAQALPAAAVARAWGQPVDTVHYGIAACEERMAADREYRRRVLAATVR